MLEVVGVRHHSPACARLVRSTIDRVRPRFVLIEGPSDMNERIGEIMLPHRLPIAVFSYRTTEKGSFASWGPFCDYSPEYVALAAARDTGAEAKFIDLPAWDRAFSEVRNRYSDRHAKAGARIEALRVKLGVDDVDGLWDHLFEQPMEIEELSRRLDVYFQEIREDEPVTPRDEAREAFMARWIAWAMDQGGDVVVVCGGFHKPALETIWRSVADRSRPATTATDDSARIGSYLVPYSFKRLDSFVGYESGMPSPAFYQRVWESGADAAGEAMMFEAIVRLRAKKQRVSAADAIAATALARGLSALRAHAAMARCDVLDGLAGALVKDSLDAPLPWSRRGTLLAGTEPMLVEVVAAFSGERVGKLAEGTPRPPLVHDAFNELERVGLSIGPEMKTVTLPLVERDGLERSRVLHRLRVLDIPGFVRRRAPTWTRTDTNLTEEWRIAKLLDADSALIEAAAYGATLEAAAAAKLEERAQSASGLGELAAILFEVALIGVHTLAGRLLDEIRRIIAREPSLEVLGDALGRLLSLWKHDTLLGAQGAADIGAAIAASFDRGLWLFEGVVGATAQTSPRELAAIVAMRESLRHAEAALGLDRARAHAVMHRRAHDREAPPSLRGAALGFLWSTAFFREERDATADATSSAKAAARPETFGDYLAGLFALAREEVVRAEGLLDALDSVVANMTPGEFLIGVPSLRLAFGYFPPQEKESIAKQILAFHGHATTGAHQLLSLDVDAGWIVRGKEIDADAAAIARRFGIDDDQGEP